MAALPPHSAFLLLALVSSGAVWGCIPTVTPDDMYDQEYLEEEVRRSVLLTTARLAPPETSPATSAPTAPATSTTTPATSTTSTSTATTSSTTTTTTTTPMPCPTDWILNPLTEICYFVVTSPATWQMAEVICGNLDMSGNAHLASIEDQNESDFISNNVAGGMISYWIGLRQLANTDTFSTMGMWSDGSLYDYTGGGYSNWNGGTPPGMFAFDECAYLYGQDGEWYFGTCGASLQYICEVPAT